MHLINLSKEARSSLDALKSSQMRSSAFPLRSGYSIRNSLSPLLPSYWLENFSLSTFLCQGGKGEQYTQRGDNLWTIYMHRTGRKVKPKSRNQKMPKRIGESTKTSWRDDTGRPHTRQSAWQPCTLPWTWGLGCHPERPRQPVGMSQQEP